jgi:serine/threonine protein kinase
VSLKIRGLLFSLCNLRAFVQDHHAIEEQISAFLDIRHELQLWAQLSVSCNPRLVALLGITADYPPSAVMEYCALGDLCSWLYGKKSRELEQLSQKLEGRIALDIALALSFLHTQNPPIIHRDVRSPNILLASLDENANVVAKLADFGLATTLSGGRVNEALVKNKRNEAFCLLK